METLPLNPMQPYIDYIKSLGVDGRIIVWCHHSELEQCNSFQSWTAFIGEQQFSTPSNGTGIYRTFAELLEDVVPWLNVKDCDPIALGM